MCLILSVECEARERERLVAAAKLASTCGLVVEPQPASRWPWARGRPAWAEISEDGGCSCSLLGEDADWNAPTWRWRADLLATLVATLRTLFAHGPAEIRVSALWLGDEPEHIVPVTADELLRLAGEHLLGTKTTYVVTRPEVDP